MTKADNHRLKHGLRVETEEKGKKLTRFLGDSTFRNFVTSSDPKLGLFDDFIEISGTPYGHGNALITRKKLRFETLPKIILFYFPTSIVSILKDIHKRSI